MIKAKKRVINIESRTRISPYKDKLENDYKFSSMTIGLVKCIMI